MRKILSTILFTTLFFFAYSPTNASSDVVINEVFPDPPGGLTEEKQEEWVELYNMGSQSVDLNGYKLKDAADHELIIDTSYTQGSTTIQAGSWLVVQRNGHSTFSLNNTSETISLFDTSNPSAIDSFSYTASLEDKSISRIPDGGSISVDFTDPTKGFANSLPSQPTSTPTLSPTSAPTQATYKINQVKNEDGETLSSVKIYVDGTYIHHYAPETIEFCDGCDCDGYVSCGFGEHTIKLEKSGYEDWSEVKTFNSGDSIEANPVMNASADSSPSNTPSPTFIPTKTPTPKPKVKSATDEAKNEEDDNNKYAEFSSNVDKLRDEMKKEEEQNKKEEKVDSNIPLAAGLFIVGGLGFVSAAAYPFIKSRKKRYNQKSEEENNILD